MHKYLRVKFIIWGCLLILLVLILVFPATVIAESNGEYYGAVHQAWLDPSPSNPGAEFGNAVAVSGDTLVVGARYDSVPLDKEPQYYSGAAYVYIKDGNAWVQQARLAPTTPQAGDLFGGAVDIDGDTIVIGAVGNDSVDENGNDASEMGAVYVFTRSDDQWEQQAKIEPEDGIEADYFGNAVAIAGERIVVGASGKDIGNTSDAGKVYSYYRSATQWRQSQSITALDPDKNDAFGSSLDLDGPRLIIGSPSENNVGAAYVFYKIGSTWALESRLDPDDNHEGDYFGTSVSIEDETVVVGAPFADPDLGSGQVTNAGAVYVFKKKANTWEQDAKLVLEDSKVFDKFGESVSTSGNAIVVGAPGQDYYSTLRVGSAYTFKRTDGSWEFQTQIMSADPYNESNFGASVAINGESIVIGQPGTSPWAGAIHIYSIQPGILPETGFAPGAAINPPEIQKLESSNDGSLYLEIPKISLYTEVVGVPRQENTWDVQWLSNQVGHLKGTAYPTHLGSSAIAGHINLPNGTSGPFADIDQLNWGDKIIIHLEGHEYIYEVREIFQSTPNDMGHLTKSENYDWLTLITCKDYNSNTKSYNRRTVVVAVRIE